MVPRKTSTGRDRVSSFAFSIGVIQRSFVWTVIVAASAIGLVVTGGASADSPAGDGDMSAMLAQTEGK